MSDRDKFLDDQSPEDTNLSPGNTALEKTVTNSPPEPANHPVQSSHLASTSAGDQVSGESGECLVKSPVPLIIVEEIDDSSILPETPEDCDRISTAQLDSQRCTESIATLKNTFTVLLKQATSIKPMHQLLEEQDVCVEETFVQNSSRVVLSDNEESTADRSCSETVCQFSQEDSPDYLVQEAEDSSSSLDISADISNLEIAETEKSTVQITVFESPPKRKLSNPALQSQSSSAKKVRILEEAKESDIEGIGDSKECTAIEPFSSMSQKACTPASGNAESEQQISKKAPSTGSSSNSKSPTVHFPDEMGGDSTAKRMPLKRTQIMSCDVVKDITDAPSDPKKKKEDE